MDLLLRARGPHGVVLVSDAVRPTGLAEGTHRLDDRIVRVQDGAVRLPDGGLAGSVLTLDRALANVVAATGRTVGELWPISSANAAVSAGVSDRKGLLRRGMDADLVLLAPDLSVAMTVVEGEIANDVT
jgi:N-acetylglucosamine-6-phosphate deacetylase